GSSMTLDLRLEEQGSVRDDALPGVDAVEDAHLSFDLRPGMNRTDAKGRPFDDDDGALLALPEHGPGRNDEDALSFASHEIHLRKPLGLQAKCGIRNRALQLDRATGWVEHVTNMDHTPRERLSGVGGNSHRNRRSILDEAEILFVDIREGPNLR